VLTFVMSGFSKILALPQVKLGWIHIAGPEPLKSEAKKRLEFIADTYLSVNSMIQAVAPSLLLRRAKIQEEIRNRIAANEASLFAAGIPALPRQGGWYAILPLPPGVNDDHCCQALLEKFSLLVHPGYFYDFAESDKLVVSLITPEEEFANGLKLLSTWG
jgi:alanine-synthesizing transaminase